MSKKKEYPELLEQLEFLFRKYSEELRATTQPYILERVKKSSANFKYHPEQALIRETLMEHVGSLPMVATTIFPHIADKDVDIGDALTMLAIHDIGELVTGDEMTFTKKKESKTKEYEAALGLLHENYHVIYKDVENQKSKSAKFAKAIDKITPDIMDYLTPADITIQRYKHFVGVEADEIVDLIVKHKRPYMLWNDFMTGFHIYLMAEFEKKLKTAKNP